MIVMMPIMMMSIVMMPFVVMIVVVHCAVVMAVESAHGEPRKKYCVSTGKMCCRCMPAGVCLPVHVFRRMGDCPHH